MRPFLLWLVAMFALSASIVHAELPPRPQGPIADIAAIIPDGEEAALDAKLRAYDKATGRAIIVATVPSLDGQVVERYAQDLARVWDIGGAQTHEGVLVLVAPAEHKVRIHVAVGSQGRLTDGLASRIISETMVPRFKAGDFGGGIAAGVDQITAQLDRDEVDAKAVAEAAEAARHNGGSSGGSSGAVFPFLFFIFMMFVMFRGRRRLGRRSGIDPGIVLWGVSEILSHASRGGGGGGFSSSSDSGGGFGGFGGGGGGFDGGGASGDW